MRLLWVENHAVFARMAQQQFLVGHDITVVPSLAAAKQALASGRFDVVLLDYDLDDGKGTALIDALKAQTPRLPIIAVSARDDGNAALLAAGADVACAKLKFADIANVLQRVRPAPYPDRMSFQRITVIDSHTGGEPTRIIVGGGPDLGTGSFVERRAIFRDRFDWVRSATINEPRGSDVLVGGLLCEPVDPSCCAGVIFFNNASYLGMCGHGTIGLVVTLGHMGRIKAGKHKLETPVGIVGFDYDGAHGVTIENVPCYRYRADVPVEVPGIGRVVGDIAWGGNWFFLVGEHGLPLQLKHVEQLTDYTWRIRQALATANITGADGGEIDHIELFGPPQLAGNDSRNFVLCPGKAYDRSPCGTGTSAKLACLYAAGKLQPGATWRQESIIGSVFAGSVRIADGHVLPSITGTAYITAEATLLLDDHDPFRTGITT